MKEKDALNKCFEKLNYVSPVIKVEMVELESSISAGSARIIPSDTQGEIKEEWDVTTDETRPVDW
ncbi:hypothetical protein BAY13_17035 [Elizabethkingia bruuniana]|uniref:hypothetical protein n=1 Tax=Elizabethkingia bruuniana TaxID=1756149 RepID=UPI0009997002|nr:hypothetical protein [Elizabethkingia bruuniana]OPC66440.1 hypothetical protein BAY13_17035 [Elizabethkingia bruuniana]